MKVAVFSTHGFEKSYLENANNGKHDLNYLSISLNQNTVQLSGDAMAVSIFVNDDASLSVLKELAARGVKYLVLRSAGYNNVDVEAAGNLKMKVARVPAYSPHAIAEHTVALMLALNRKLIRANARVHDLNFLLDGLTGFNMNGKTVGIVGTGSIGRVVAKILHGFGCKLLAYDPQEDDELKIKYDVTYTDLPSLFKSSDIITLHAPLLPSTRYLVAKESLNQMKKGVMLINTGRGALINTRDVIEALKSGKIGYLGLDVYEEEGNLFFQDHSEDILQDDIISRLLTFPNVLITSHQGFLTDTALQAIAETTIRNLSQFEENGSCENEIHIENKT